MRLSENSTPQPLGVTKRQLFAQSRQASWTLVAPR